MAHNPRWKKWFGIRNSAISTNPVRFLRGQVGDSDNIDLNLNNIKVVGGTDAIDYDGAIVADGDAQLDAYANAQGIVLDAGADVDYEFAFDAAGQMATDKLYLDGSNGSGHSFALGWTFCDDCPPRVPFLPPVPPCGPR